MKNLFFLFAFLICANTTNLNAQVPMNVNLVAVEIAEAFTFNKTVYNYGEIPQDIPATAEFTLTNNSNKPLIITKAKGSCGCTAPTYDDQPIAPGETTIIKAVYNAKKTGPFTKTVSVMTNLSDAPTILKIKGTVLAK